MIRASDLAAALAEGVNPTLPDGFSVVAEHGVLRLRSSTSWARVETDLRGIAAGDEHDNDLPDTALPREYLFDRVAAAVERFLSNLQDYISEDLTVPWPQERTSPRMAMAMPFVAFEGHKLRSGFEDPHQPSVEFPSIELTLLVR